MTDEELILKMGNTKAVSVMLGVSEQCVSNWKRRGIPAQVKLDNLELFKNYQKQKTPSKN